MAEASVSNKEQANDVERLRGLLQNETYIYKGKSYSYDRLYKKSSTARFVVVLYTMVVVVGLSVLIWNMYMQPAGIGKNFTVLIPSFLQFGEGVPSSKEEAVSTTTPELTQEIPELIPQDCPSIAFRTNARWRSGTAAGNASIELMCIQKEVTGKVMLREQTCASFEVKGFYNAGTLHLSQKDTTCGAWDIKLPVTLSTSTVSIRSDRFVDMTFDTLSWIEGLSTGGATTTKAQ